MEPSPSPDRLGSALLDIAESSIVYALDGTPTPRVDPAALPPAATTTQGAFVTLHVAGRLAGCIGTIEGDAPLHAAVARLARSAAFEDPRFSPLRSTDLPDLELEVSVLSPLEPIPARDLDELLAHLEPGHHGLVVAAGRARAVFLPDVWEQLPRPSDFVAHLFAKAGLPPDRWPRQLQAWRFTTCRWSRPAGSAAID